MEEKDAIKALAALAHDHRMQVFRLLVRAGPMGLVAGEIAERIGLPPSSLSFHLSQLSGAGIVLSRRVSRNVYYAIDFQQTRGLLNFLMEDCCLGLPELCGTAPAEADPCCTPEPEPAGAENETSARQSGRR